MRMVLQYIDDPTDQFKVLMPARFDEARDRMRELVELRDRAKESYARLLRWLKVNALKSSDFCMIWDNLFVPEVLFAKFSEKTRKTVLVPRFCHSKSITLEDLMILWGFQD